MSSHYFFILFFRFGHVILGHDVVVLGGGIMMFDFLVLGIHHLYSWLWSLFILPQILQYKIPK